MGKVKRYNNGKHYQNQRKNIPLFILSFDGMIGKEAQVLLNQSSGLMTEKLEEPISHMRGWVNGKIVIAVTRSHSRTLCGSHLPSYFVVAWAWMRVRFWSGTDAMDFSPNYLSAKIISHNLRRNFTSYRPPPPSHTSYSSGVWDTRAVIISHTHAQKMDRPHMEKDYGYTNHVCFQNNGRRRTNIGV